MISISLSLCKDVISRFFHANSLFPHSGYGDIARSEAESRLQRNGGDMGKPRSWRGSRKSRRRFFRASKTVKSQHAQRLASDRRDAPKPRRTSPGAFRSRIDAAASKTRTEDASAARRRPLANRRSCQPAESGHSVLPLIVIAGKASNNGEARQGGRHDHEHWQAARSALEDGDRLRSGGLGAGVRPGLRRRPDHRRADHEGEHQSVLRENEGRRGSESEGARGRFSQPRWQV